MVPLKPPLFFHFTLPLKLYIIVRNKLSAAKEELEAKNRELEEKTSQLKEAADEILSLRYDK